MAFIYFNPNPIDKHTGDCVIQALCKVLDQTWEETFMSLSSFFFNIEILEMID